MADESKKTVSGQSYHMLAVDEPRIIAKQVRPEESAGVNGPNGVQTGPNKKRRSRATVREVGGPPVYPTKAWIVFLILLLCCFLLGLGLILGYYVREAVVEGRSRHGGPSRVKANGDALKVRQHKDFVADVNVTFIQQFSRKHKDLNLHTGSEDDLHLVESLRDELLSHNAFDSVHIFTHYALTDLPDIDNPNIISIVGTDGQEQWSAHFEAEEERHKNDEKNSDTDGEKSPDTDGEKAVGGKDGDNSQQNVKDKDGYGKTSHVPGFAAYSAIGTAKGDLVYVYDASMESLSEVSTILDGKLGGKIAIARLGSVPPYIQKSNVESAGMSGLLLYADPADKHLTSSFLLPQMADSYVPYVSTNHYGNPLPESERSSEANVSAVDLGSLKVQTISREHAKELFSRMEGTPAEDDWQGGLEVPYKIMTGEKESPSFEVQITVNNIRKVRPVYNVVATVYGSVEAEHSVVVGCSRTGFFGASNGIASSIGVMVDASRRLGQLRKEDNWRPYRTLMFGFWGASEFGNIGLDEFIEKQKRVLRATVLANVDIGTFLLADGMVFEASTSSALLQFVGEQLKHVQDSGDVLVYDDVGKSTEVFVNKIGSSTVRLSLNFANARNSSTKLNSTQMLKAYAGLVASILMPLADNPLAPFNAVKFLENIQWLLFMAVEQYSDFPEHIDREIVQQGMDTLSALADDLSDKQSLIEKSGLLNKEEFLETMLRQFNHLFLEMDRSFLLQETSDQDSLYMLYGSNTTTQTFSNLYKKAIMLAPKELRNEKFKTSLEDVRIAVQSLIQFISFYMQLFV